MGKWNENLCFHGEKKEAGDRREYFVLQKNFVLLLRVRFV